MPQYLVYLMDVFDTIIHISFTNDAMGNIAYWIFVWAIVHIAINIIDRTV